MSLGDIKDDLRYQLAKGTSLDSRLLPLIRKAVSHIEQRKTFKYMERFSQIEIDADDAHAQSVGIPQGFKSMVWWRITSGPQEYPKGYFQDGMEYFWFDVVPTESFTTQMFWIKETEVLDDDDFTCWLFENRAALVVNTAAMFAAPGLRDPISLTLYKELHGLDFEMADVADEETRNSNTMNFMEFGWEHRNTDEDSYIYLNLISGNDVTSPTI